MEGGWRSGGGRVGLVVEVDHVCCFSVATNRADPEPPRCSVGGGVSGVSVRSVTRDPLSVSPSCVSSSSCPTLRSLVPGERREEEG